MVRFFQVMRRGFEVVIQEFDREVHALLHSKAEDLFKVTKMLYDTIAYNDIIEFPQQAAQSFEDQSFKSFNDRLRLTNNSHRVHCNSHRYLVVVMPGGHCKKKS